MPAESTTLTLVHRIVVDIAWTTAAVFISLVILRELSLLTAGPLPSVSRGIEFGIGTGGSGAGTAG